MRGNRKRDTRPELALRRALHGLGLRYRVAARPATHLRWTADVVFSRARVAVFVDGCFWHSCPVHATTPTANREWWVAKLERNERRDRDTDAHLRRLGWTVLRFWEHEDACVAVDAIEQAVRRS